MMTSDDLKDLDSTSKHLESLITFAYFTERVLLIDIDGLGCIEAIPVRLVFEGETGLDPDEWQLVCVNRRNGILVHIPLRKILKWKKLLPEKKV